LLKHSSKIVTTVNTLDLSKLTTADYQKLSKFTEPKV